MRLVILGGPGAGKGTQVANLCEAFAVPGISAGDLLREAIAQKTELGRSVKSKVDRGELVEDQDMIPFMRDRLHQKDVANGWVLDGYPRTAFQAEELEFLLDGMNQSLRYAVYIEVPPEELLRRSLGRGRSDDAEAVVQRRIKLFHECTAPLLEYYAMRLKLLKINGNQSAEAVEEELLGRLGAQYRV